MDKYDLILDAECDNLLPFTRNIWCVVVKEVSGARIKTARTREDLLPFLGKVRRVIGHNILGFDLEVLSRIWQIPYTVGKQDTWGGHPIEFVDTLVLSQFMNPDRVGGHSLKAWGDRLGFRKTDFDDWSEYSIEQEAYCYNDVFLTEMVYHKLLKEMGR